MFLRLNRLYIPEVKTLCNVLETNKLAAQLVVKGRSKPWRRQQLESTLFWLFYQFQAMCYLFLICLLSSYEEAE